LNCATPRKATAAKTAKPRGSRAKVEDEIL